MKLRLRSLETKETIRIQLPTPCSLQHLREVVLQRVSSSSSSAPASVHLSLNRKDELLSSSPQDSLQSLGVTSGDLVFFTFNHNAFSSETLIVQSNNNSNSEESLVSEPNSQSERTIDQTLGLNTQKDETLDFDSAKAEPVKEETLGSESGKGEIKPGEGQIPGLGTQMEQTPAMSGTENMEIDFENNDDGSMLEVVKSFSVPSFLRKVFRKEVGEGGGGDHKLLVIAVHAVLLESGFVGFDSVSRMKVEGFHLSDEWPSIAFTMSLWYTLPEIIDRGPSAAHNGVETVVLKIQSLGKYVNIYGSLSRNGSGLYRVCVDEDRVAFFLNLIWANCDKIEEINGKDSSSNSCPEKEVFEFWKNVKDRLALPLLIDLCEKAGLAPPPCFMRLPTDLKLKILESLPGVDVAKVGCVCSELRYLSSNDDLWKQKLSEQFGNAEGSQSGSHWKEKFAKTWVIRKKRKTVVSERLPGVRGEPFPLWVPRIIRDPYPHRVPRIIGGDYDLGPSISVELRGPVRSALRRNVMPHCNLGGRSA